MDFNWKDIGQNIKLRRIKLKLKQSELAELVDVSSQHISHCLLYTSVFAPKQTVDRQTALTAAAKLLERLK